ncbi:cupin domain-containing protein [Chenggangzhangella methanolivorans]|uniref:Cupin domain-containing protein n=1 Tax=Chenggangzhangella methanolivorans TaxID=1437009 RepID=A0A9E6UNL6_9HYPH|nr:cupin domain-containing protein [Chenggangzhangella methanolivorans]QZN98669.1 cupin domain-containing protein [Chenggangzhangella methanolivorans]
MSLLSQLVEIALDDPKLAGGSHPAFVSAALAGLELQSSPIEPSWILAGDPRAEGALHSQSADACSSTTVWACSAGKFRWNFVWDETVYIVSGSVVVTDETGATSTISAGDVAYFAAGSWATWEIADHVKKVAFCRKPFPTPVVAAMSAKRRLWKLLRRGPGIAAPVAGPGLALTAKKP